MLLDVSIMLLDVSIRLTMTIMLLEGSIRLLEVSIVLLEASFIIFIVKVTNYGINYEHHLQCNVFIVLAKGTLFTTLHFV